MSANPKYISAFIKCLAAGILYAGISTGGAVLAQELPDDPTFKERKAEEGYTLDLKTLINKSKKRIEQVEDKLKEQAKERRNERREAKAREYYEKAQRLYDEGKFDEAVELWEKAIRITEHDEMEGYVHKSVSRQRKKDKALKKEEQRRLKRLEVERGYSAKEVDKKYREAVELYKDKDFLASKVVFEEVNKMFPDHRATRSYIALIDRHIEKEQRGMIESKLNSPEMSSAKAKARWKEELKERERQRENERREQADALYEEGIRLYKSKQYEKAKEKFKEVEWVLPDYKRTLRYLSKIDKDIEKHGVRFTEEDKLRYFKNQVREGKLSPAEQAQAERNRVVQARGFTDERRRKEEAEFVYDAAETLYRKKYYKQALEKFYEVRSIYPGYKKTDRFIKKLHKRLPDEADKHEVVQQSSSPDYDEMYKAPQGTNETARKAIANHQNGLVAQAEEKYQQAVMFYNKKNFTEAQRKFIAVEAIIPGYKATREHLARIDGDIARHRGHTSTKTEKSVASAKRSLSPRQEETVKDKYRQARRLYKDRNYQAAKDLFVEINKLSPGYRSTMKYISRSNRKLEQEKAERDKLKGNVGEMTVAAAPASTITAGNLGTQRNLGLDEYERFKQAAYAGEEYQPMMGATELEQVEAQAVEVIEAVTADPKLLEEYDPSDAKLSRDDKRQLEKQQEMVQKEVSQQQKDTKHQMKHIIGDTYDEARELYQKEEWAEAKIRFETVERLSPGYRRAKSYIKRINRKIMERQAVPEIKVTTADGKPIPVVADVTLEDIQKAREAEQVVSQEELHRSAHRVAKQMQEEQKRFAALADQAIHHSMEDTEEARKQREAAAEKTKRELKESMRLLEYEAEQREKAAMEAQQAVNKSSRQSRRDLDKLRDDMKDEMKQANRETLRRMEDMVATTYDEAKDLFKEKRYTAAKLKFETVQRLHPGYRRVESYLKRVDNKIRTNQDYTADMPKDVSQDLLRLKKQKIRLKAEDDAYAVARVRNNDLENVLMTRKEYTKRVSELHAIDEEQKRLAGERRMKRLEQERLLKLEEKLAFERALKEKEAKIRRKQEMDEQEKEEIRRAKRREHDERLREAREHQERMERKYREDLKRIRKYALKRYRDNDMIEAQALTGRYEDLLAKANFSERERIKMRQQFSREKKKILKEYDRDRYEAERILYEGTRYQAAEAPTASDANKIQLTRSKELEELEAKIREEERKLQRAREEEEKRRQEMAEVRAQLTPDLAPPTISESKTASLSKAFPADVDRYVEIREERNRKRGMKIEEIQEQKRKEIESVVKSRQAELRKKREEVQEEFDKNIKKLYKKAVRLYKKKNLQEAEIIFEEIQIMKPEYKKTEKYLTKIRKKIKKSDQTVKAQPVETGFRETTSIPLEPIGGSSRQDAVTSALDAFERQMW